MTLLAAVGLIFGPIAVVAQAASATTATGAISGTVTDTSSAPLANICAYAWGTHGENTQNPGATTAADGTYTISGLAPGQYIVFFQSCDDSSYGIVYYDGTPTGTSGYREASDVVVSPDATTTNINAEIAVAGSISGTVTDTSNAPLAGSGRSRPCSGSATSGHRRANPSPRGGWPGPNLQRYCSPPP